MSLNRHILTLDEQFFQSVLSAAFTIQEHNQRRKLAGRTSVRQSLARPEAYPAAKADRQCGHCGAPMSADASRCGSCGLDDFRRGERMQSNWASTLINQEQGSRSQRAPEIREGSRTSVPPLDVEGKPPAQAALEASAGLTAEDRAAEDAELTVEPIELRAGDEAGDDASGAGSLRFNGVPRHSYREIVEQALQATHAAGAAIALKQRGELICRAATGDFACEIGKMINAQTGFTGVCASSGTMQLCSNTALDPRVDAGACRKLGVGAIIVVPLVRQDRCLGLIAIFSRRPYAFGMRDLQALHELAQRSAANLPLGAGPANANHEASGSL
jgi:putative methionine-R-sulfoxide reductase with GAF domain